GKRLEFIKEIVPRLLRVAVLWNPNQPGQSTAFKDMQVAAQVLKVTVISIEVRNREEIERVPFDTGKALPQALFELPDPLTFFNRKQFVEFAVKHWLPAMYCFRVYLYAVGIIDYGTRFMVLF